MPLARPLVVGPVSILSQRVRVRNQFTDATVVIRALGAAPRTVAKGRVASGDDRVPLVPGEKLLPDDVLYAIQELNGDTSPEPNLGDPLGISIQKLPAKAKAIPPVTFASILYTCGRAMWLRGGVPGASAQLVNGGAALDLGTFEDEEGARVQVSGLFGSVQVRQAIPGVGLGPPVTRTVQDLPHGNPLPAPDFAPIPVACKTTVGITKVIDGAEVTLRRDDGQQVTDLVWLFDAPSLQAPVGPPMIEGEMLTVSQSVHPECARAPSSRVVRVERAEPVPKPVIGGPLCAGAPLVHVREVISGAGVEVTANGQTYRAQVPPDQTFIVVVVDPLEPPPPGGSHLVTARQEQCGVFGPPSDPAAVVPLPASLPPHEIVPPLLDCSPIVRVAKAHPRALLMAFSDVFGPISNFVMADAAGRAILPVAPQLVAGHQIEVRQWACGGEHGSFAGVEPLGFERPPTPSVGRVLIGRRSVEILNVLPGATVEVVVTLQDGTLKEADLRIADDKTITVGLQSPLDEGDRVKARQSICQPSGYSDDVTAEIEPIAPDWWQWDHANPRNVLWKEDYVVSGRFTNNGGTPITDIEVTIFEDMANLGSTGHGLVSPAQSVPGATAPIKKDWQWIVPALWKVEGPLYKELHYRAIIAAIDATGDPYTDVTSAELRVFVNVSKLKRTSGALAMGAAISAAAMAASIILLAAAAAAYAAASVAGAVALDPPEPDPEFRTRVPLPELGPIDEAAPDRNVQRLLRLCERLMKIERAKSLIKGKRFGAVAAEVEAWITTHTQDLAAATLLQLSLIDEILALAPQAKQDATDLVPAETDLRQSRLKLQTTGLTTALADQMGLPEELRPDFDTLLRSDVGLPDPNIVASMDAAVAAVAEFKQALD